MRPVEQWYVNLPKMRPLLEKWLETLEQEGTWRSFSVSSVAEHLEPPVLHLKADQQEEIASVVDALPPHHLQPGRGKGLQMHFGKLGDMEKARRLLSEAGIRCRSGKTLVPFRLTGDLAWGLEVPALEGMEDRTFWVWPESLWAPLSFSAVHLGEGGDWKEWWCNPQARAYQFIGEDNVFFYGPAQTAMFLGLQRDTPQLDPPEGELQLPQVIANKHLLFLDRKASSSGQLRPPSADELLAHYTAEQLRAYFFAQALGQRSVSFRPAAFDPKAAGVDPVLKEGNLLCNAFNKAARSSFYTVQRFCDGQIPVEEIGYETRLVCETAILEVEAAMMRQEFHRAYEAIGVLVKDINRRWSATKPYAEECEKMARRQALADAFHAVRTAAVLLHPVAPEGTERIRCHLKVDEDFWDWAKVFAPVYVFMDEPLVHRIEPLKPREDFFPKHPSQING
jgi:methionyl-tRNA synthetase